MPNKEWRRLNIIDSELRKAVPPEMTTGTQVQLTIEKICGFELFNSRPYHNHETWSDGWRIRSGSIEVTDEDLDDAVKKFVRAALSKGDNAND